LNEIFRISKYATPETTKSVSVGHGFLSCHRHERPEPGQPNYTTEILVSVCPDQNAGAPHTSHSEQHSNHPAQESGASA